MSDQEKREYTTDDILALPEGVRAELIDGKMYYMASPTMTHQRLLVGLTVQIYNHQGAWRRLPGVRGSVRSVYHE